MKELGKSLIVLAVGLVTLRVTAWGIEGVEAGVKACGKKRRKKAAEAAEVIINDTEAATAAEA